MVRCHPKRPSVSRTAFAHIKPAARRGFTLIELLVVIAIISLIISILLPSLQHAKELARETVCLSNTRNIGMVMQYYAEDNGNHLPIPCDMNGALSPYCYWSVAISKYITEDESVLNPTGFMISPVQPESLVKYFQCPTLVGMHPTVRSTYVMNNYAMNVPDSFAVGLNLQAVADPYRLVAVGEGAFCYRADGARYEEVFFLTENMGFYHHGGEVTGLWKQWFSPKQYEQTDGRGTLLMVDGHALSAVMDDIPEKYFTIPF